MNRLLFGFLLVAAAHGQNPCKGVPLATFTDASGIDWRANHSWGLGIEQKGTPKVGCNYSIRDWPIPFPIKRLTLSGTFAYGVSEPSQAMDSLARIWILPCGPGHGTLEEQEPYTIYNVNGKALFDRGTIVVSNVPNGPFPPPCSDGSGQVMRVEITVASSRDKVPAELELWGRWE